MNKTTNLFDLNPSSMREYFTYLDEKPFRATQVLKWVYHHGETNVDKMTDLSQALRDRLSHISSFNLPVINSEQVSADGTRKWLMQVDDKNSVETVFIPETDRGTLCISSQVGCPLDCSFCSTGKQGFNRNLGVAEIIGQFWLANERLGYFTTRDRIISNVVMMGMGEPLLNFDNVIAAIDLMTDDLGFGLSFKRVTLSTAGLVPGIDKLGQHSKVSLAVSLHAANDKLRDKLVPINRKYPIKELLAACQRYSEAQGGNPVTFEYVMLDNVNDSDEDAYQLAALLRRLPAKVNLIPFNAFPGSGYTRSTSKNIDKFREILMQEGLITITRKNRGNDIDAACGQLTGKVMPRANRLMGRVA